MDKYIIKYDNINYNSKDNIMVNNLRLKNKTAIVTGGASGIGEQIVRHYVSEGCSVVILDKNLSGLDLENELNSTKIKWLNFYQVMLESENHLNFYPFKLKGHFTPQGYKTLAKEIQNFLQ